MVFFRIGTAEFRPGLEDQPRVRSDQSRLYQPPGDIFRRRRYLLDVGPEERAIPLCREDVIERFEIEKAWDAAELCYYVQWSRQVEPLQRCFHPGLGLARYVAMRHDENGNLSWVVEGVPSTPLHSYIGNIPILIRPWCYVMPPELRVHPDMWYKETWYSPRHLLHDDQVHALRIAYPRSLAVQVLLCGLLIIQYRSYEDIVADWNKGVPFHFRGLPVTFNVLKMRASTGQRFKDSRNVAMGLRLKLETGKHVITTWTSELIRTGVLSPPDKTTAGMLKQKVREWRSPDFYKNPAPDVGITRGECGKLFKIYDEPFKGKFPEGITHDLAFIKPQEDAIFPTLVRLPAFPHMVGFSGIQHALCSGKIFITGSGVDAEVSGRYTTNVIEETGEAAVQGIQYYWGDKGQQKRSAVKDRPPTYTRALLWTVPREGEIHADPDRGRSGAIICQGSPLNEKTTVVVMENFEVD
ncbi:uncharacterized protein BROUX77_003978 [Berkeleyomyces rouxiae]|uniref:uncharacterized protein n=1 Tax=Berkeleyomyces rouxiae TaxID=2035830 RepID=UPI003B778D91